MALSNNIVEYEDCRDHLDRALASRNGIRITCPSPGKAIHLRQRLYKLRQLEKIESTKLYEVGDPRRNSTPYENLEAVVVGPTLEIRPTEPLIIEEL
jgi:hypothetical protein